jgi:hypothetical protein
MGYSASSNQSKRLKDYVYKSKSSLSKELIKDVYVGKIYYVHRGRNAWHSTWRQHYFSGCMHPTLGEAKKYAETSRGSGSVFYIYELPCMIAQSASYIGIVVEINRDNPLEGYKPFVDLWHDKKMNTNLYSEELEFHFKKRQLAKLTEHTYTWDNTFRIFDKENTLDIFLRSFNPYSPNWEYHLQPKGKRTANIMRLWSRTQPIERLPASKDLRAWKSKALHGWLSQRYAIKHNLGWITIENMRRQQHLHQLLRGAVL